MVNWNFRVAYESSFILHKMSIYICKPVLSYRLLLEAIVLEPETVLSLLLIGWNSKDEAWLRICRTFSEVLRKRWNERFLISSLDFSCFSCIFDLLRFRCHLSHKYIRWYFCSVILQTGGPVLILRMNWKETKSAPFKWLPLWHFACQTHSWAPSSRFLVVKNKEKTMTFQVVGW